MNNADPTNEAQTGAVPGPHPGEAAPAEDVVASPGAPLNELLSSLAGQLDQVRNIQNELDAQAAHIDERQRTVQAAEERLEQGESSVLALQTELEEKQQAFAAERETLREDRSRDDEERADLQRKRDTIVSERAALESQAGVIAERERAAADRATEVSTHRDEIERERDRLREAEEALAEHERSLADRASEVSTRGEEIDRERDRLREAEEALERERGELRAQDAIDETALVEARERLRELEEHDAALAAKVDQLGRAADEARQQTEHAANEGLENAREIEHERDAARAELSALEEKLRASESELESTCLQRDAATAREEDGDARIKEFEARIEELKSRPAAPAHSPPAEKESAVGADMRVRAMQQRIAKLEAQLGEGASASAPAAPAAPDQAQLDDLRAKAQRIARVARHLHLRHRRLRRLRRLLSAREPDATKGSAAPTGARSSEELERHYARVRKIEQQHLALKDRGATLAECERKMSRRWAHANAIVLGGWLVAMAVASAGIGWLATDRFLPAVVSASVRFEANADGTGALAEKDAREWSEWHTAILSDKTFLAGLAKRMDERRMEAFASVPALRERLARDLTVDAAEPEVLTLSLAGTRPREVTAVLDIVATTLEIESNRLRRKRSERAWAELRGRRTEDGIPHFSRLNPVPVTDERLVNAPPVAGAVFLVMLFFVVVIYYRLAKVKRDFNDDGDLFNNHVHTVGSTAT